MKTIWNRILNEPAMVYACVEAVLAAVLAFGFDLSGEQVATILGIAAVLTGIGTRQMVVPERRVIRDAERARTLRRGL